MSYIHFKFKNRQDYEKVAINGLEVSGKELKEAIMTRKNIGHSNLEIRDAQTKKVYSDTDMIKRNASVVVMRSVIQNAPKLPKTQHKDPSLLPSAVCESSDMDPQSFSFNINDPQKSSDLTSLSVSEEDKLMVMMKQAGEGYTAEDYARYPAQSGIHPGLYKGPPPRGYVCNRCRKPGHWIQLCPTNGDPAYDKRNRHEQLPKTSTVGMKAAKNVVPAPKEKEVPEDLKCPICKQPMRDAVIIPCCNKSFCDECIREHLLEKEFTCPLCGEEDVSPDSLVPNKQLRESVKQFKSQVAEEKGIAVAALFSRASLTPHKLSSSHMSKPYNTAPTAAALLLERLTAKTSSKSSSSSSQSAVTTTITSSATINKTPQEPCSGQKSRSVDDVTTQPVKDGDSSGKTSTPVPSTARDSSSEEEDKSDDDGGSTEAGEGDKLDVPDIKRHRDSPSVSPQHRSKSPGSPIHLDSRRPTHPIVIPPRKRPPMHHLPNHPLYPPRPPLPGIIPPSGLLPLPSVLPNQLVGLPRNTSLLNTLPGLGVVQTAPAVPVMKDYQAEAEFLLNQKRPRAASPPLTAEEFYRQQKILNQFVLRKSPAHSINQPSSDYSHSSGFESDVSDSDSSSDSVSESDTSISHSPSISPQKKRRRHHTGSKKSDGLHHRHHKKKRVKDTFTERERGREREHTHKRRRNHEMDETSEHRHHHQRKKKHRHGNHKGTRSHDISVDHHMYYQSPEAGSSATSETAGTSRQRQHKKIRRHRHHRRDVVRGFEGEEDGPLVVRDEGDRFDGRHRERVFGDGVMEDGNVDEMSVDNNSGMSPSGGEIPDVKVTKPDQVTAVELQKMPTTPVEKQVATPDPLDKDLQSQVEASPRQPSQSPPAAVVASITSDSGDKLLDDIDELLAEEQQVERNQDEQQANEKNENQKTEENTVTEAVYTSSGVHVAAPVTASLLECVEDLEREKEEDLSPGGRRKAEGRDTRRSVSQEQGGGDELCLHVDDSIDDTDYMEAGHSGSASDGLEEGEVLSDADLDQTLCAPGQEESGQLLESVPNKPHKKLRLRSIAQAVTSSETPDLTPTDVESLEENIPNTPFLTSPSPPQPPSSPPREHTETHLVKKHNHRHERGHNPHELAAMGQISVVPGQKSKKKRKLKDREKSSSSGHHRRRHKTHNREREEEGEGERKAKRHRYHKKHRRHSSS